MKSRREVHEKASEIQTGSQSGPAAPASLGPTRVTTV